MLPSEVKEYLETHRQEHLERLSTLLRFPSISSQDNHNVDCLACAEYLVDYLQRLGFSTRLESWKKHPIILARSSDDIAPADAPTILVYAHYDVQPPDPVELWTNPPFEPTIRDGSIYARGAADDKGLLLATVHAAEAFVRTIGKLPLNILFFFEGDEETGSPGLEEFVSDFAEELRADYALVVDLGFFAPGVPTVITALRGLIYLEMKLDGPAHDLHSGEHGGAVVNPINALARIIAQMHDEQGRVTLPGFYDDVAEPSEQELTDWQRLPFSEEEYAKRVGVEPVGGEKGRTVLERIWSRPTLDCNGIIGGYHGPGAKTVLPAWASSKISMRLVPNQLPEKVIEAFDQFVASHCPAGVKASINVTSQSRPLLIRPDNPAVGAVRKALEEAFSAKAMLTRAGGSVPVAEMIQRIIKVEPVVTGFMLPDNNIHAPDEHFQLEQYYKGTIAMAAMFQNFSKL
mgnify:CR=1 FL=1